MRDRESMQTSSGVYVIGNLNLQPVLELAHGYAVSSIWAVYQQRAQLSKTQAFANVSSTVLASGFALSWVESRVVKI